MLLGCRSFYVQGDKAMQWVILIAVVLFCSEAAAELKMQAYINGNRLLERCDGFTMTPRDLSPDERMRFNYCNAYVAGVSDSLHAFKAEAAQAGVADVNYCQPVEVPSGQAATIVVNYLRDHPEQRHLSGASLAIKALKEAFPCR
jgi:hypothetical protein